MKDSFLIYIFAILLVGLGLIASYSCLLVIGDLIKPPYYKFQVNGKMVCCTSASVSSNHGGLDLKKCIDGNEYINVYNIIKYKETCKMEENDEK